MGKRLSDEARDLTRRGWFKAKVLTSKYGWYFVGTYLTVYIATLSSLYFCIDAGWIDPNMISSSEDEATLASYLADYLQSFEFTKRYVTYIQNSPKSVNLGLAWIATKFTEPIRLGAAIYLTPKVARTLGKKEK